MRLKNAALKSQLLATRSNSINALCGRSSLAGLPSSGTLRARTDSFRYVASNLLVLLGLRLAASLALGLHFRLTLLFLIFADFLL